MKRCVFALLLAAFLAALLVLPARGSDLAGEVEAAAPEAARGLSGDDFSGGLSAIWEQVREGFGGLLRQGLSGAVQLLPDGFSCTGALSSIASCEARNFTGSVSGWNRMASWRNTAATHSAGSPISSAAIFATPAGCSMNGCPLPLVWPSRHRSAIAYAALISFLPAASKSGKSSSVLSMATGFN